MTTTPDFNINRPLVEARSRKAMDALLVTIQVQGGVIANWTDQVERIKAMDARDKILRDAMNIVADARRTQA